MTLAPRFTVVLQQVARAAAVVGRPDRMAPEPSGRSGGGRRCRAARARAPPLVPRGAAAGSIARPGDRVHERRALVRPAGSDPAARIGRPAADDAPPDRHRGLPPRFGAATSGAASSWSRRAPAKGLRAGRVKRTPARSPAPAGVEGSTSPIRSASDGSWGISRLGDRPPLGSAVEIAPPPRAPRRGASSWRWAGRPGRAHGTNPASRRWPPSTGRRDRWSSRRRPRCRCPR